jgi:hypothetical protein
MTNNEPKLRSDEMIEYEDAFQAGFSGEDYETDSLATMRGYRDGCAHHMGSMPPSDYEREVGFVSQQQKPGDPKPPADDDDDFDALFTEETDDDESDYLDDEARSRIEQAEDERK